MEVIPPAEAAGASEDIRGTLIRTGEDCVESGNEAKAEYNSLHDQIVSSEKADHKTSLTVEEEKSQSDNAETSSKEAAGVSKAFPHQKELENAEITLVVEMSTDAEFSQDIGQNQEKSIGHCRDATFSVEQVCSEDSEMGIPATAFEAAENVQQQKLVSSTQKIPQDSSANSKMHETGGKELEITDFQHEVAIEEHRVVAVTDEAKSFKSKEEEEHFLSLVQTREATVSSPIERTLGDIASGSMQVEDSLSLVQTREATARSPMEEAFGDMASGSLHMSISNEDERRNKDFSDLTGSKLEAGSEIRPCRKRAAEKRVLKDRGHMSDFSDNIVDAERKKGRTATEVSVQLAEQCMVTVVETESDYLACPRANGGTKFVQGLESDIGERITGQEKEECSGGMIEQTEVRSTTDVTNEQGSGRLTAQTELRADITDLDTEGVQAGSAQSLTERNRVNERTGCVGEVAVLTVSVEDKHVIKEVGKSFAGVDTEMVMDQHVEIVAGEGTQAGRQELLCQKDLGASGISVDIGSVHPYLEVESGVGQGAKQDVMDGKESPQGNNEAAEKDGTDMGACIIEAGSSNESSKVMQAGQETQQIEATTYLFGQDTLVSAAVPGSLQPSASGDGKMSHTDVLQPEGLSYQKADSELKVKLAEAHHEVIGRISGGALRELSLTRSEKEPGLPVGHQWRVGIVMKVNSKSNSPVENKLEGHKEFFVNHVFEDRQAWGFQGSGQETGVHPSGRRISEEEKTGLSDEANTGTSEEEKFSGGQLERGHIIETAGQKRKLSDDLVSDSGAMNELGQNDSVTKKAKKKAVNVWAKTTSRKGPKKNSKNGGPPNPPTEDSVLLTPVYVNQDKVEDGPDQPISLSKYDKAEKIELSENRLSASSTKGYRMVRATRGVQEGTWYYEIIVEQLGPTGHTRLGWSTQKGDVQAPVGFDSNSYGYRDLDGSKTHVAVREVYGDLYVEGDVIGFYIHLPNGAEYAPKQAPLLSYRGRPFLSDGKEEQARRVPGSEICFFRNGVCQGTAFKDIYGGRYFPAASMYTLPKEPCCTVRFNFGPDFRYPPKDLDGRPAPTAMVLAPYHNVLGGQDLGPVAYANISTTGLDSHTFEPQMKMV
ncbi:hypothetical protein L7F22_053703 [Adiantum nelumboides]|nr:hypothetical protein [Adiantum nelumboides]